MSNIVDSHCHLDFKDFNNDLENVVNCAYKAKVKHMLSISVNLEDFDKVYKVTSSFKNIYCTTGVHPNNVPNNGKSVNNFLFDKLRSNLKKKVIGVGETGLDFLEIKIIGLTKSNILKLIYKLLVC